MTKPIKAHPAMMFRFVKPFLFVLIIPVIKGVVQYLLYEEVTGVLFWELLALSLLTVFALLNLKSFKILVQDNRLTVERGAVFHRSAEISFKKVSSIVARRNILDFIFGSVTVQINTEAGRVNTPDFQLKLSKANFSRLYTTIYGEQQSVPIKFSPVKIALQAAVASSAVTGLVVGVPVIHQIGKTLGFTIGEMFFDPINNASHRFNTYMPPVVNAVTIVLLACYGISFIASFFKNIGFSLRNTKEKMQIESGFFVKKRTIFRKDCVNALFLEQRPLMRLFRVYCFCASVAGLGMGKKEWAIIMPAAPKGELKEMLSVFFGDLLPKGVSLKAPRSYKNGRRFLFLPTLFCCIIIATAIIEGVLLPDFLNIIILMNLLLLLTAIYYGNVCLTDYRSAEIIFGENIYAQSSNFISRREIYCKKEKIGILKISRTPADRYYNTCKVKITVRSESAKSLRIKNLDHALVLEEINGCYGINLK